MTTGEAIDRRDEESLGSVRQRLSAASRERWTLVGILAVVVVVHGWRAFLPFFVRGDLLYHWGLTHTILLGSFPPEGPYAGLPAYYPPGFHLLLAGLASLPVLDVPSATALLGIAWLPVIPLGAYLLARRVSGRGDVALVAAALTAFGGGLDVSADRLWVNSMFMVGQVAYPIYPRDLVFGILPFAVLAYLRATDGGRRWLGWALLSGLLLGACALIQVQLLLPIPLAFATLAAVRLWRDRSHWRPIVGALVASAIAAVLLIGPWLIYVVGLIRRNGGVSIESSEDLLPVRIGFWDYPIQFGLILPLAVIGAGVALLLLRRPNGPSVGARPAGRSASRSAGRSASLAPRPVEGGLFLIAWWIVPFILAVFYRPDWPLEDALRPQRMWLLSSQPGVILAAIGLIALVEAIAARPGSRLRRTTAVVVVTVLVASAPATAATTRLMGTLWTDARYAHLRLGPDRVPEMDTLLDVHGPRPTILTYEDWSSLVWYETGAAVVAVDPPGYAKLAFDPGVFTGHTQAERRADLAAALSGDVTVLIATADRYGADRIVLARRGATVGLIGEPAVSAAAAGSVSGPGSVVVGNGWDAEMLEAGTILTIPIAATGRVDLEFRVLTAAGLPVRFNLVTGSTSQDAVATPVVGEDFSIAHATVDLPPGTLLRLAAIDPVAIQSITGFVADPGPPPGWTLANQTDDAIVWRRVP